jgi:V8-like Glu-specific endopeptidase
MPDKNPVLVQNTGMKLRSFACLLLIGLGWTGIAHAETPAPITQAANASVQVACDLYEGSGTVINGVEGYVLTAGHVVIDDLATGRLGTDCSVGFADSQGRPRFQYQATIIRAVYNEKLNQDFAILKIGSSIGPDRLERPFPSLLTNEFSSKGDSVYVIGYPGPDHVLAVSSGAISDFTGGFIDVSAKIIPGDSGGSGVDAQGRLIGVPTRIETFTNSTGQERVTYQLVDIRAVMNWLDTFGANEHDKYFTHADPTRYHQAAVFITQENLGCTVLGRSPAVSSVYCIMADGTRLAFPTDTTYFSWFADFTDVKFVDPVDLTDYRLTRNVTFKPGTLVKSASAPAVYVVVDSFGTLRKVPSEEKAAQLWGPAWGGLVFDIPDEFWTNYTVGQPLDP